MNPWITSVRINLPFVAICLAIPLLAGVIELGFAVSTELFVAGVEWPETLLNLMHYVLAVYGRTIPIAAAFFVLAVPVTRYKLSKNEKIRPME